MDFSETLRLLRKDKKLSRPQLADELGVSLNTLTNYELKRRLPNAKALVMLEKYFNVDGNYLMGDTFTKDSPKQGLPPVLQNRPTATDEVGQHIYSIT